MIRKSYGRASGALMTKIVGPSSIVLIVMLALTVMSSAQSPTRKGLIWKVERAGDTDWLVGSLHMLTPDAYPLPATMTSAFDGADVLMEEADPDELASPQFAAAMLARAMYMEGDALDRHVSPETFRLISERAGRAGLPVEVLRRMKPWMVSMTLQALELQRGGFDPSLGVDVHFHQRARTANKRFLPLETGLEQVSYLESLGSGFEDALIRENLQGAETEVNEVRRIAAAWAGGDAAALEQIMLGSLKDAPAVYQSLIVARNRAWLPKIRACIDSSRCFVVVGAGHLVGADGLVSALRAAGYAVQQQ